MGEFDLIDRFFKRPAKHADLGVGDDCALLSPRPGHQLALSADMLVEGRHFLSTVDPATLGHKSLAVNLSDLAACGAEPRAFLLSLSLPRADVAWLQGFSQGLFALADAHGCELIGGDTTQGPLNISITVLGDVPRGQALLRSGARAGDDIFVSGTLGDARLALEVFRGKLSLPETVFRRCRNRMEQPTPRVALGIGLRGVASAAADISDGLLGDLGHILRQSGAGARLDLAACEGLLSCRHDVPLTDAWLRTCVLSGGDDYELVFTAPPTLRDAVQQAAIDSQTSVTCIGTVTATTGIDLLDRQGHRVDTSFTSFD
ncbi:MAG: thiamine-phosphate kinase, partial [Limnohabitans sp.]